MVAIVSDIHGNLEALLAVLADSAKHDVATIFNLGDTVGYGPNPVECVQIAMSWPLNLQGNFDHAAVHPPDGFSASAEQSLNWSRERLERADASPLRWLDQLPSSVRADDETLFVHGSAHNPRHEYVFPEDIHNDRKMARIAAAFAGTCFCGHTHWAGVFFESRAGKWEYAAPTDVGSVWRLDGRKTIINVGSVGQPRDGDWRAGYVLWDGARIEFRRVEYDVERTVRKIHGNPALEDFLGDRLREGR